MAIPPRAMTVVLVMAALTCNISISGRAQPSGFGGGAGGSGPVSPSVVATWAAHFEAPAGQQVTDPFGVPLMLDLLVLWRGNPGWFDEASLSTGSGGTDGVHHVASRGRSLELRFDRRTETVQIQRRTITLQGANVLLLDDVDNANGVLVAGMIRVDPAVSAGRPAQGGPNVDPLAEMIRRSPALFDFLRCDPVFTDPNDPSASMRLRQCAELR